MAADRIELSGNNLLGGASSQGLSTQSSSTLLYSALPMGDARFFYAEEEITLSKSADTTTSAQKLFPLNAFILGISWRITEALVSDGTTLTALQFGDGTTAARWGSQAASANAIALNVTGVGNTHLTTGVASDTTGPFNITTAKNLVTTITGSSPSLSAGKVKVCVYGIVFTPPAAA